MSRELNLDIPSAVVEFETLINKVYPKKFFYKLLLRGKGLEFDGYRKFSSDEDSQFIDWKASVRANSLLAKQYIEERDIKTLFLVDVSSNMVFGSQNKLKCEYSAEVAAAFAKVLLNGGDKVGFILFNNRFIKISIPENGVHTFDIFCTELADPENYGGYSNINNVLNELFEILNPSISLLILLSDFILVDESSRKLFERIGSVAETISLIIRDPLDNTMPDINKEFVIQRPGTSEKLIINPSLAKVRYEQYSLEQKLLLENIFTESGIDFLQLLTSQDFAPLLVDFLKSRAERR